ncbi:hypothetical protein D1114_09420 [Cereibacter sphaeroides]|uniref:Uncharacterized protein n=1 Tax=Cereibacter sphaeroides TaxID=1063 RepID=A0AAX1UL45_CERSP|nr:hypothetical protein [Cereibacter sphaeroides]EGJ20269.1 hypothetical protein RSWS8N_18954 [Cereibacter sphaeroides WS8N]MWP37922.1 hypothetical protein [Cereibacter sphaeroides]RHZ95406.1 hypothetical protein D1114_09420 [Cereibacter sphaeroides]
MPKWMLGRALTLVGLLGVTIGGAAAQTPDSRAFATEAAARAYLRQNPAGPMAKAAFLALVEFRLMRAHPGLSRAEIIAGFARAPAAPQSPARAGGGRERANAMY